MLSINTSKTVNFSDQEMFNLVNDVTQYPKFLPGVSNIDIIEKQNNGVITSKTLFNAKLVSADIITEHLPKEYSEIVITLKSGPFNHLSSSWQFTGLGENFCEISFQLEFEFSDSKLELILKPILKIVTERFVQAFIKRAKEIYG